jgi:hypothetical protein
MWSAYLQDIEAGSERGQVCLDPKRGNTCFDRCSSAGADESLAIRRRNAHIIGTFATSERKIYFQTMRSPWNVQRRLCG